MRVLITNNTLAARAGSELYVRDVAIELLKRGHQPVAYSTVLGEVASELRRATIPVIDDLDSLAVTPDLIHGQHHLDTMTALLRFPGVPAVYFCHGWLPWEEAPPRFPRILRYVAVDYTCRDRILLESGVTEDRIRVIHNFVDLSRFKPRNDALPKQPRRALVFSNNASERTHLPIVRQACAMSNIELEVIGLEVGEVHPRPEKILPRYDLVFAKARSALEALAVGCSVIVCDATGSGPMVDSSNLDRLRELNFGIRALSEPLTVETVMGEIGRYDPDEASEVSSRVRSVAGLSEAVDRIVAVYQEVLDEAQTLPLDAAAESVAAASYLRWLSRVKYSNFALIDRAQETINPQHSPRAYPDREAELRNRLDKIESSLAWRIVSKYGPIKHRFVLPACERVKRVLGMRGADQGRSSRT